MLKTAFGLITAGVGGLYTVLLDEACDGMETVACRAKGAFRHAEQKPLVGDRVEVPQIGLAALCHSLDDREGLALASWECLAVE